MKNPYPACRHKCARCYYYKINKCIAQAGDDFFIPLDESEKDAIYIKNLEKKSLCFLHYKTRKAQ